jgi:hypothetical protein
MVYVGFIGMFAQRKPFIERDRYFPTSKTLRKSCMMRVKRYHTYLIFKVEGKWLAWDTKL